jgi:hypothetical protein
MYKVQIQVRVTNYKCYKFRANSVLRVAAYSLLVELAKNCAENTKLIVDELVPI